jgi:hypothetical protein
VACPEYPFSAVPLQNVTFVSDFDMLAVTSVILLKTYAYFKQDSSDECRVWSTFQLSVSSPKLVFTKFGIGGLHHTLPSEFYFR